MHLNSLTTRPIFNLNKHSAYIYKDSEKAELVCETYIGAIHQLSVKRIIQA